MLARIVKKTKRLFLVIKPTHYIYNRRKYDFLYEETNFLKKNGKIFTASRSNILQAQSQFFCLFGKVL